MNNYFFTIKNLTLAGLIFSTCFLTACGNSTAKNDENPKAVSSSKQRPTLITTHTVSTKNLQETVSSFGEISAINAPIVSAEVSGTIISVNKDIGASVEKGELLAKIDPEITELNYRSAKANLERAKTQLANQERIKNRSSQLLAQGFISQARYDDIKDQLTIARQQLTQAKAQMDTAAEQLARTNVKAPVTGNVVKRMISVGDFVAPGTPLFKLSTAGKLQVILMFPETLAPRFKTGQLARLSSPANPDSTVEGRVTDIVSMIDSNSRSVKLVVEVENPGAWKPGASVTGNVILDTKPDAVVVPPQAVVLRPAGNVVYVIENDIAKQRIVTVGQRSNGMLEIISGLKQGESIANDGAGFLADNAPVLIRKGS